MTKFNKLAGIVVLATSTIFTGSIFAGSVSGQSGSSGDIAIYNNKAMTGHPLCLAFKKNKSAKLDELKSVKKFQGKSYHACVTCILYLKKKLSNKSDASIVQGYDFYCNQNFKQEKSKQLFLRKN